MSAEPVMVQLMDFSQATSVSSAQFCAVNWLLSVWALFSLFATKDIVMLMELAIA